MRPDFSVDGEKTQMPVSGIDSFLIIVFFWAKQLPEYGIYLSSYQPTHFNTKFKSRKVENAQQLSDRNIKQREEKWKFIVWDN